MREDTSKNRAPTQATALDNAIQRILSRQMDDAYCPWSNSYWSHNGENVGDDVASAVQYAIGALRRVLEGPKQHTLAETIDVLLETRESYRRSEADLDGILLGNLGGIIDDLAKLVPKHGDQTSTVACVRRLTD